MEGQKNNILTLIYTSIIMSAKFTTGFIHAYFYNGFLQINLLLLFNILLMITTIKFKKIY
jgi:hypothetical protein